jgi:diguanylate cyclase (GGDEF)-like protein
MKLQMALHELTMPVNDHIIHANPAEQDNYRMLKQKVSRNFDNTMSLKTLFAEQIEAINEARNEWITATETANAIMSMENPVGDPYAAARMELFDKQVENSINILDRIHHLAHAEIIENQEALYDIKEGLLVLMIIVFIVGVAISIYGFVVLARATFAPLEEVTTVMDRFSKGELDHRIDREMVAEVKHLADGFNTMADNIRQMKDELERLGIEDPLTGSFNRRKFHEDLEIELSRAKRLEEQISILMIDLDHFKSVNDSYGHMAGDVVLKTIVTEINHQLREYDTLYRYGGEEFIVILPESSVEHALIVGERIRSAVSNTQIRIDSEHFISVSTSIGISTFPEDAREENGLLQSADQAVYAAKKRGRNRVCHFRDCS